MLSRIMLFVCLSGAFASAEPGDLWKDLSPGPYDVGFQFQRATDLTRNINSSQPGTPLGLALWYPAPKSDSAATFMTQLDYRLLEFSKPLNAADSKAYVDEQARQVVTWRHIGIVPLTVDQARETFNATGRAVRDAPRAKGKFPVVIILGGPWYLSTTAEFLAGQGYLVVACVRYQDARTEIPSSDFRWSIENSLRDAEWALSELRHDPSADIRSITSLGHGGGGLQAMLLGMRDHQITAVANLDAGIFSSRTNPAQLLYYDPRLLRVPYLFLLTAETRHQSDQYADFEKMKFSRRYEVIVNNSDIRHHDLSNVGRAVSSSLGIRGDEQPMVLKTYADVQTILLQFLNANNRQENAAFAQFLQRLSQSSDYTVTTRDAIEPAPERYDVLNSIELRTPDRLRRAYKRDPEAETFSEDGLLQILSTARSHNIQEALNLVPLATEIQPKSIRILQLASAIAESSGNIEVACDLASRCLVINVPDNDWRAQYAHDECQIRIRRLRP